MPDVKLVKGNIVKNNLDDSTLYGKQGEVIRVYSNGTVIVRFPVFMIPSYLFWHNEERRPINVTFKGDEVADLLLEDHWDEQALTVWRAEKLWPRFHHSVCWLEKPFEQGSKCTVKGCEKTALKRGLINYVGSVYPVDMCAEHCKRWDEKAVEDFPVLKP